MRAPTLRVLERGQGSLFKNDPSAEVVIQCRDDACDDVALFSSFARREARNSAKPAYLPKALPKAGSA